jgi:hypothetical protein
MSEPRLAAKATRIVTLRESIITQRNWVTRYGHPSVPIRALIEDMWSYILKLESEKGGSNANQQPEQGRGG